MKNIWPEIVLQENFINPTNINSEPKVIIARSVNDAEQLDEEELVQLRDISDPKIINSSVESLMQIIEEIDENLCIENLNKLVKLGKQLEILVTNCDSSVEFINLQHGLAPNEK